MHLRYPDSPAKGGKLTNRLTLANWRDASLIRFHPTLGYIRVSIVGMRYYDRGAGGGFMCTGAWVYEGRVVCSAYPESIDDVDHLPTVQSVAGWGYEGSAPCDDGHTVQMGDKRPSRDGVQKLGKAFWSLEKAIEYANGLGDGAIARKTEPVHVQWTKAGYKLVRLSS